MYDLEHVIEMYVVRSRKGINHMKEGMRRTRRPATLTTSVLSCIVNPVLSPQPQWLCCMHFCIHVRQTGYRVIPNLSRGQFFLSLLSITIVLQINNLAIIACCGFSYQFHQGLKTSLHRYDTWNFYYKMSLII